MRKDNRQWGDGFNESLGASIFFAFIAFFIGYGLGMEMNFWIGFLLGSFFAILVLTISFTKLFKNHRESTYKLFFTDVDTAVQVVKNTLGTKNIPYKQLGKDFFIDDLTLTIHKAKTRQSPNCTIIKIRPNKINYEPLINSLQEKIDAGFVPIGAYTNN